MRVRLVVASVVALAAVAASAAGARAQPAQQPYFEIPPAIAPTDMPNYCIYENRIYSLGAGLCLGRTGYTCVPPTGPATGNRAYWSGKEDQVFTRPTCP